MNREQLQKLAEQSFLEQVDHEKSEFECFFHYTDDKLYEAGFIKGYEACMNMFLKIGLNELDKLNGRLRALIE